MDSQTYVVESQVEQNHWWFVGRRKLFRKTVEKLHLSAEAKILDIGTSTGTNLRLLRDMGFVNFLGLDSNDDAIRWCAEKGLGIVSKGDICAMPFEDSLFDLVLATDIIEHVDDDIQALREIRRVLTPHGRAIITVPAFQSLWGLQDEVGHHKRRYTRREVLEKLEKAGLQTCESYYFNYILFFPIWIARQLIRIFNLRLKSENQVNSPLINSVLKIVFALDTACAGILHVPFGVSIIALIGRNSD